MNQKLRVQKGDSGASTLVLFCVLIVIPGYALSRLGAGIDWRLLVGVPLALSVFAFFIYRSDKRRAETGEWRTPEATLHLVSLIGGWPGAFLAMRVYRHKTAKGSFQILFWLIVILHQFIAIDSLNGWRMTTGVVHFVKSQLG